MVTTGLADQRGATSGQGSAGHSLFTVTDSVTCGIWARVSTDDQYSSARSDRPTACIVQPVAQTAQGPTGPLYLAHSPENSPISWDVGALAGIYVTG